MSNKLEVIRNQPELFKKFKTALGRGEWLDARIILGSTKIDVFLLPLDHSNAEMTQHIDFTGYTEEVLAEVNKLLDERAKTMKERWKPHFEVLNECTDLGESADYGWSINVNKQDYAILEVGRIENLCRYRLKWSYDGLLSTADYLSERSDADLEGDD